MDKIKQYFQTKAISNSFLGTIYNPRWVKLKMDNPDMEDEDTKYFRIGSALDCLLTDPDRWEQDFLVVDATRPFGFMGKFIDVLPAGLEISSPIEMYQEAYDKAGYKMSISRVVEKFWGDTDIQSYYQLTRNVKAGVTIIGKDEYESVTKAKELILANEFIMPYFREQSHYDEIMRQVPIYFKYEGFNCKALLDGIWIDHKSKRIKPYDLKTIGKTVYDFPMSYLQFGYYRQCAFYELALLSEESPIKEFLDNGYKLDDFRFIVVESKGTSSHPAIIYKTCWQDRFVGLYSGNIGKKRYKGINELLNDYKYHLETNKWDLPRDLYSSSGEVYLNIFDNAEVYGDVDADLES